MLLELTTFKVSQIHVRRGEGSNRYPLSNLVRLWTPRLRSVDLSACEQNLARVSQSSASNEPRWQTKSPLKDPENLMKVIDKVQNGLFKLAKMA